MLVTIVEREAITPLLSRSYWFECCHTHIEQHHQVIYIHTIIRFTVTATIIIAVPPPPLYYYFSQEIFHYAFHATPLSCYHHAHAIIAIVTLRRLLRHIIRHITLRQFIIIIIGLYIQCLVSPALLLHCLLPASLLALPYHCFRHAFCFILRIIIIYAYADERHCFH